MANSESGSPSESALHGVELHGVLLRQAPQWSERLPAAVQFRRRLDGRGYHVEANATDCAAFCESLLEAAAALPGLRDRVELSLIPVAIPSGEATPILASGNWLRLNLRWPRSDTLASIAFDLPGNYLGSQVDASLHKLAAVATYSVLPQQLSQAYHFPVHWIDPERAIPTPRGGHGRVLFVDDEPMVLEVHRQSMESLGYEAVTVQSGNEALELFRAAPDAFDLILSDQSMPEMDGNQLARAIRDLDANIPIVLCTGLATLGAQSLAERAGVTAILEKPFTLEELAQLLRGALHGTGQLGAEG